MSRYLGSFPHPITILVPQGAEHHAILKGLKHPATARTQASPRPEAKSPVVIPIPIGPDPVQQYLKALQGQEHPQRLLAGSTVVLMGLGGSLSPALSIGNVTLVERCIPAWTPKQEEVWSDRPLLTWLQTKLGSDTPQVRGLTSKRLISSVNEKNQLYQQFNTPLIDMEGYSVLRFCQTAGLRGAVLRVVSDDCDHDVPDVNSAISADGTLRSVSLALGMLRQPVAAWRLIRGSMVGLRVLTQITQQLFQFSP